MRLLLDTHALLWWLTDDERLGSQARELIENSSNDVLVSVVSLWEVVVKVRVGKLRADIKEISEAMQQQGFAFLGINAAHLSILEGLPMRHRDPFDHLLISQAIAEDAIFISEDRNTPQYPVRFATCSNESSSVSKRLPKLLKERPIRTIEGGAELVRDLVEGGHRYRITKTSSGYLITGRTRNTLSQWIPVEWFHRTEEAAIACLEAVMACNAIFARSDKRRSETALMAFEAATQRHNEACERLDDPPLTTQEVRNLRERIFPE